jgi:aminoglycoside phosphotransferase (APT) family kinase protein
MRRIHDPSIPGLAEALDVEQVLDQLRAALPECRNGLNAERVRIYDVQYKPRERCTILYAVKFRRPETGRSETQWLSAVLLPDGEPPVVPPDDLVARYRASIERPLREPVVRLPGANLIVYGYPFDPSIPTLVDASDPDAMQGKLGRMWKKRAVRVRRVAIRPLSYTPGARVAMLLETLSECRVTGLPEVRYLVGKIDAQRNAADLFAQSWAAWKESALRIQLAPPVGYVSDFNLFLQERVDGVRLSDQAGTGNFIGPVRQTAGAAAVLHAMELPLRSRRPHLQSVKAIRRWGSILAAIRPSERGRIRALRDRLGAELERCATITGPVHGDLHPSNVLVRDNRVTLIDLDNMVLGDCMLDVGRFLSSLRTSALRVTGSAAGLTEAGEAFLERYLSQTGEDERRARLFEAASLLITAGTGFRLQREGWEETAGLLVDEAERVFDRATTPSTPAGRAREVIPRRGPAWASDPQYMHAALGPHVRRIYGAEIGDCAIQPRRTTARRERLRYRLSGWRNEQPWKISLVGILWSRRSGRRVTRRMTAVYEALAARREAPLIPRPVAYVREVGLQVLDVPRGIPLSSVLTGPEAATAIELLARSLASFHATPVSLDKSRALEEELRTLRTRVERLRNFTRAGELMQRIETTLDGASDKTGPVVRHLSPRRILLAGEQIALAEVDDVVLSDPLLDVAEVIGQLMLYGFANGVVDKVASLATRFRDAYFTNGADGAKRATPFEAAALLGLACAELERGSPRAVVDGLLDAADRRLEQRAPQRAR